MTDKKTKTICLGSGINTFGRKGELYVSHEGGRRKTYDLDVEKADELLGLDNSHFREVDDDGEPVPNEADRARIKAEEADRAARTTKREAPDRNMVKRGDPTPAQVEAEKKAEARAAAEAAQQEEADAEGDENDEEEVVDVEAPEGEGEGDDKVESEGEGEKPKTKKTKLIVGGNKSKSDDTEGAVEA